MKYDFLNRRAFLKAAGAAAVLGLGGSVKAAGLGDGGKRRAPSKRPNFVFFLIDDMGWKDLGCYGSTFYETPNVDRLGAQGMRSRTPTRPVRCARRRGPAS